ncbi:TPA: hypothetical protein N0F65_011189 [Lagenidium giganteum]|uniref:DUF7769 domain-containing protein n=1 Tax=Lagenidium giganteum TaxID=4803 RepID=A0AAV2Z619_9STRA|nr:TPA: hypothetical protein N0F65_011189 [Lagenidium giganteum]
MTSSFRLQRRAGSHGQPNRCSRQSILHFLLEANREGELRYGSIAKACSQFITTRWTVQRIWDRYNETKNDGESPGNASSRIKRNSGRKPYDTVELVERIRKVPPRKRRKMHQLASAIHVSVSVLRRLMIQGQLPSTGDSLELLAFGGTRGQSRWWRTPCTRTSCRTTRR